MRDSLSCVTALLMPGLLRYRHAGHAGEGVPQHLVERLGQKTLTYYWALVPTSPVFQLAQQQPDALKYDSRDL